MVTFIKIQQHAKAERWPIVVLIKLFQTKNKKQKEARDTKMDNQALEQNGMTTPWLSTDKHQKANNIAQNTTHKTKNWVTWTSPNLGMI